jgi:hypothetical protein
MAMFEDLSFKVISSVEVDSKFVQPTLMLYEQIGFKLNVLYHDIRAVLQNSHEYLAEMGKALYEHPVETLSAWSDQLMYGATDLYTRIESDFVPEAVAVYQHWQSRLLAGADTASQYWQRFYDDPEQATMAAIEPVSRYLISAADQSEQYWQMFTESAEAGLIGGYYILSEWLRFLIDQPDTALTAMYTNALSILLNIYYDAISALLIA